MLCEDIIVCVDCKERECLSADPRNAETQRGQHTAVEGFTSSQSHKETDCVHELFGNSSFMLVWKQHQRNLGVEVVLDKTVCVSDRSRGSLEDSRRCWFLKHVCYSSQRYSKSQIISTFWQRFIKLAAVKAEWTFFLLLPLASKVIKHPRQAKLGNMTMSLPLMQDLKDFKFYCHIWP